MAVRVKVTGLRETDRALMELPKGTARNVLKRVAKGALDPMASRASNAAPTASGKLSFNIGVSEKRTGRARKEDKRGPGGRRARKTSVEMFMGPHSGQGALIYASFVEFGTVDQGAQPYMRPAWDAGARPALEYIKDELWTEISKAAARVAKRKAKKAGAV